MIDLTELNKINSKLEKSILKTFKNIPVRVDEELRKYEYYIVVSPELLDKLKKEKRDVR